MPNWDEIRNEWETTKITLAALAEKHDVKLGTLKSRKSREGWLRDATKNATPTKKVATIDSEPSWIGIENEYVTDIRKKPCTLKDLAKKHNISISRIEKYAAENNWSNKRNNYAETVQQKHKEKSAELISNDLAEVTARHFRLSDKLLKVVENALSDDQEFYKYVEKLKSGDDLGFRESIEMETLDALNESKLLTVVNAADKLQKMQRQTLGILDAKDKHKVEMDKRKMGDLADEYEDDGFIEALGNAAVEVWDDDSDDGSTETEET